MTLVSGVSRLALFFLILLSVAPAPAFGQQDPNGPDPSKVKVRFGPVMLNPSITLGDIGVDENVFNEATNPRHDLTATFSPRTDVYLRFLGTWFTGTANEDLVWYQKYSSERQANGSYGLAWKWPLTRLTINASGHHIGTRERPGYEIDARAERVENAFTAGAAFRFLTNTAIEFTARRDTTAYDASAQFEGVSLENELDVNASTYTVGIKQRLTPLTSATIAVSRRDDRYPLNPLRDSKKTDALLAMAFDPLAILRGTFSIGYTDFEPKTPGFPSYTGATLAASLAYTLFEATKFTIAADREVQDSYDINQPYYVQTGGSLDIAQQLFGHLDVVVRGGIESLAYRDRADVIVDVAQRNDHVVRYGAGIGYHHGQNLRLGLNFDQTRRDSQIAARSYRRPSFGASLTYDF